MDNYNTDSLTFNGYLYSDGIFPDIHKPLKVRPDFSLGFIHYTDENGLLAYNGKGVFTQKIDLSNQGLRGSGKLDYTQSHGIGKDILFFPDSMNETYDMFMVDDSKEIEYSRCEAKNVYVTGNLTMIQMQLYHQRFFSFTYFKSSQIIRKIF